MHGVVEVNITRFSGTADKLGTRYTICAPQDATLAALRTICADDQVMDAADKFSVGGRLMGKSMEERTQWYTSTVVRVFACRLSRCVNDLCRTMS